VTVGFRNPPRFATRLQTASSGRRIVAATDTISWFTGDPQELFPGTMVVDTFGGNQGRLTIQPPAIGTGFPVPGAPSLTLSGQKRDGSSAGSALLGGDWQLGNSLNPVTASSAVGREYVESVSRIIARTGYVPSSTTVPAGLTRTSGVGTDPPIADFFLTRACTVLVTALFRLNATGSAATFTALMDGSIIATGVHRSGDETRTIVGAVALAAGWHSIDLSCQSNGTAVTWTNASAFIVTGNPE
jgi:hypothetical protein